MSRGTWTATFRIDPELWRRFGEIVGDRSVWLREQIAEEIDARSRPRADGRDLSDEEYADKKEILRANQTWRSVCDAAEAAIAIPDQLDDAERRRMVRQLYAAIEALEEPQEIRDLAAEHGYRAHRTGTLYDICGERGHILLRELTAEQARQFVTTGEVPEGHHKFESPDVSTSAAPAEDVSTPEPEPARKFEQRSPVGDREVRRMAEAKGYRLYRGDAFGCSKILADGTIVRGAPYSLLDDSHNPDSDLMDDHVLLCRISLQQAHEFLSTGTVPEGHELYEPSPFASCEVAPAEDVSTPKRRRRKTTIPNLGPGVPRYLGAEMTPEAFEQRAQVLASECPRDELLEYIDANTSEHCREAAKSFVCYRQHLATALRIQEILAEQDRDVSTPAEPADTHREAEVDHAAS